MAGHPFRKRAAKSVAHTLWAKALAIEDGTKRVVIVATDLIGLPREITDVVCARLQKEHRLERSQVLFNSSHTHNGPVVWPNLRAMFDLGKKEKRAVLKYAQTLASDLFGAITESLENLEPASLSYGCGKAHFAVNRRELTSEGVRIGINPVGAVDLQVPVLQVRSPDQRPKAVVFGYACHNTTCPEGSYELNGDYAGCAQIELEKNHPGATAIFLMLCGGDQNPNPRGSFGLAECHGKTLAAEVDRLLSAGLQELQPPVQTAFENIDLAFAPHTRQTFEKELRESDPFRRRRATAILKTYDDSNPVRSTLYPIQAIRLGSELTILALGGEVMASYSLRVKKEYPGNLVVTAYSNDVMSYIPSKCALREGGYEIVESMAHYSQPGPYSEDVENRIFAGIRSVFKRVGLQPKRSLIEGEVEGSLRARLMLLLRELSLGADLELTPDTSLLRSGLLDSLATLQLTEWIQREVGPDVDLLQFDLSAEWETVGRIEQFVERYPRSQLV
jgi:neutral ceramidase